MKEILDEHFLKNGKNLYGATPQDVADVIVKMYKKRKDAHDARPHNGAVGMTPAKANGIHVFFLDKMRTHKTFSHATSHQVNLEFAIPGFNILLFEQYITNWP